MILVDDGKVEVPLPMRFDFQLRLQRLLQAVASRRLVSNELETLQSDAKTAVTTTLRLGLSLTLTDGRG